MENEILIQIEEENLKEVLREAVKEAFMFDWTGWRIPIFVEKDGKPSKGSWMGQGSWQPGCYELPVKIETWDLDYDPDEEDMDYEIDERVEFILARLMEVGEIEYGVNFEII